MSDREAMTDREALPHQSTHAVAVAPYLYQVLYELASYGPLAPGEFMMSRRAGGSPRSTANSLRGLVRLGLVERADGIYSLTPKAVEWLEAPGA